MKKKNINWSELKGCAIELERLLDELNAGIRKKEAWTEDVCSEIRGVADQTYGIFNEED